MTVDVETPSKPEMIAPDIEALPTLVPELVKRKQWLCWVLRYHKGKWTKVPRQVGGKNANTTDPDTWSTYEEVVKWYRRVPGLAGIGYVFAAEDPYCGIDLDDCRDPDTGKIAPWAQRIIDEIRSYTEISPSGTGVKIYAQALYIDHGRHRAPIIIDGRHAGEIEVYDRGRYFAMTGRPVGNYRSIEMAGNEVANVCYTYLRDDSPRKVNGHSNGHTNGKAGDIVLSLSDQDIIDLASRAKNGAEFSRLWSGDISGYASQSEADLALVNMLAFYVGPDPSRIDELFRQSGLCREKWTTREDYREWTIGEALNGRTEFYRPKKSKKTKSKSTVISAGEFPLTDSGNAERMVKHFGADFRHCPAWNKYLVWAGTHWKVDDKAAIHRIAKTTVRMLYDEAAKCTDDSQRIKIASWATKSESRDRRQAMVTLAAYEDGIAVSPSELDNNPWLLNVKNGTLDLRSGELRPHSRSDLITKISPIAYDPEATCYLWQSVLHKIFAGKQDLIAWLQRFTGYCLTGIVREQILPIAYGEGQNGKSTYCTVLQDLLGEDYSAKLSPEILLVTKESHPTGLTDLFGKRTVIAIETEDGKRLSETTVKELTGSDKIRARRMREDFWEFAPTHKILLVTNHKPKVRGTDYAIWRRIRLIPFNVVIKDDEKDLELPEKLKAEYPGILAWAVDGCLQWQAQGLGTAEDISIATAEYRDAEDVLGQWIAEQCLTGNNNYRGKSSDLYSTYRKWCESVGEYAQSHRVFGQSLTNRGFEKTKSDGVRYIGIAVRG